MHYIVQYRSGFHVAGILKATLNETMTHLYKGGVVLEVLSNGEELAELKVVRCAVEITTFVSSFEKCI